MDIDFDRDAELKKLDEKLKDAEENYGDIEVRDAILSKAEFYEKINEPELAIETYKLALTKAIGVSKKLEIVFCILKIVFLKQDLVRTKEQIDNCKQLLEEGGDWERRNRLKVYEGLYKIMIREFKSGANLLLDTIATFNSPEIISYNDLIFYTVIISMVSLSRADIKKRVVHSPEILSSIRDIPNLKDFLESFYKCQYQKFFQSFYQIIEQLQSDKYLSQHKKYFIKEMRVVIYSQFLESYKTVTLENIAKAFGVSVQFIDKELSDLISSRRLNCKIDKVQGLVESERIDERNKLYQSALKQGDYLLNRIQKLSKVIDI